MKLDNGTPPIIFMPPVSALASTEAAVTLAVMRILIAEDEANETDAAILRDALRKLEENQG